MTTQHIMDVITANQDTIIVITAAVLLAKFIAFFPGFAIGFTTAIIDSSLRRKYL